MKRNFKFHELVSKVTVNTKWENLSEAQKMLVKRFSTVNK